MDLFSNRNLLTNIRRSPTRMRVRCNAGWRSTNMVGDLPGYGTVWYDPRSIANILSLSKVNQKYHVRYDSSDGKFVLTKADGSVIHFVESSTGLFFFDTAMKQEHDGCVFVSTVADNKSGYTNEDYRKAVVARDLLLTLGRPSVQDFIRIVHNKLLTNCPVTVADIQAAEHIFGPDVGSLRVKTTRRRPHKVDFRYSSLPVDIMAQYRHVTIAAEVIFVNGIGFLVTYSRKIRFGTVEAIRSRKQDILFSGLKSVMQIYSQRGFKVTHALMDNEFEPLRGELAGVQVQLDHTGADDHVGDIERWIRTVKERMRAIITSLPFQRLPPRLIVECAKSCVFWLNAFPHSDGISNTMSPREIVTGQHLDYNRHCRFEFGEYVQTHEAHDNSMAPRTVGALALRPTGNAQGSYYFFSLKSGLLLTRTYATKLPMPDEVIDRVHALARRQRAQLGLLFGDRLQRPAPLPIDLHVADDDDEDDDDSSFYPDDDEDNDSNADISVGSHHDDALPLQHDQMPGVDQNNEQNNENEIDHVDTDDEQNNENENEIDHVDTDDDANDDHNNDNDEIEAEREEELGDDDDGIEREMDDRYGARTDRYDLRPRKQRDYSHLFAIEGAEQKIEDDDDLEDKRHLIPVHPETPGVCDETVPTNGASLATSQMSMKKGIKVFGNDGVDAVRSELQQLHDRAVMRPRCSSDISRAQKRAALAYLMFLKRKRCGRVKGRGCPRWPSTKSIHPARRCHFSDRLNSSCVFDLPHRCS
jgi:hypothetical protein